jgi:DtxR family transcriptional regulator, Mn-dependent transcriptional regulator
VQTLQRRVCRLKLGRRSHGTMPPTMPKQVSNVASDDFLSAIYRLHHDEGQEVISIRLADRLGITPPSVAGMLKRLQRDGFLSLDTDKVIRLTAKGLSRAEQMVRRHRLAECLITDVLKVAWWRAYEEAHLLEHGLSDITEPQLFEALGRPQRSPFGYPIPGHGSRRKMPMLTLADVEQGETVVIDRVFEEDEQLLQFFDQEGIRPGEHVTVEAIEPYRGTVTTHLLGRSTVIGTSVARRIWVARR